MIARRQILRQGLYGMASLALSPFAFSAPLSAAPRSIQAVAFDAFPVFDPRPVFKTLHGLFPDKGEALQKLWVAKQFGYTWLRTSAEKYKNFYDIIGDALMTSADELGLALSAAHKDRLLEAYLSLPVWPDAKDALQKLRAAGLRLAFLSNMTEEMLKTNMAHNDITALFDFTLSTDRVQAFKPAPAAYQMGVDAFNLPQRNIAFAAFAGWDAAGATWFGYPTVWVNRTSAAAERLDTKPDKTSPDLSGLLDFVLPT